MVAVTNAGRVVFPETGHTKGDVVSYFERIAPRALPHLARRPLTIRRFPKGVGGQGFFQKNVPPHYPESIARVEIPKRDGVTVHPMLSEAEHLAFVANQGAIELHVPTARAPDLSHPDRLIIDLDPPPKQEALVRRAALLVRDELEALGMPTVPVATGSKGYHVVAAIHPTVGLDEIAHGLAELAALLQHRHPDVFTAAFRVARRGGRVFVDWLRNAHAATAVAPYSLRARPLATIATPITWDEIESTAPDAFRIGSIDELLARPDPLAELAERPADAAPFLAKLREAFTATGLTLESFDRFRS